MASKTVSTTFYPVPHASRINNICRTSKREKKKTNMKEIKNVWKYGPVSLVHDPVLVNSLPANRRGVSESIGLNT